MSTVTLRIRHLAALVRAKAASETSQVSKNGRNFLPGVVSITITAKTIVMLSQSVSLQYYIPSCVNLGEVAHNKIVRS